MEALCEPCPERVLIFAGALGALPKDSPEFANNYNLAYNYKYNYETDAGNKHDN